MSIFTALWYKNKYITNTSTYLTTSTAPGLTLGSFPIIDTLAVNEPSILNTIDSVFGGNTAKFRSTQV